MPFKKYIKSSKYIKRSYKYTKECCVCQKNTTIEIIQDFTRMTFGIKYKILFCMNCLQLRLHHMYYVQM